jgi:hypothetical protein
LRKTYFIWFSEDENNSRPPRGNSGRQLKALSVHSRIAHRENSPLADRASAKANIFGWKEPRANHTSRSAHAGLEVGEDLFSISSELSGTFRMPLVRARAQPTLPRSTPRMIQQWNQIWREAMNGLRFCQLMQSRKIPRRAHLIEGERVVGTTNPFAGRLIVSPGCNVAEHDFH